MLIPASVTDLIERFDRNIEAYRSAAYNEAQLRREFIDPFFCALGWDIDNRAGYAEAYKDVIHEDSLKTSVGTKAPDYCFRIGGARKFFVEAKKPAVNVGEDIDPAFQLRRYAWSAKLPLSILTDFEEFAVYDCRVKPANTDKPSVARTLYVPYSEYPTRWDEITGIFSRDAVLKGSFDKYAESTRLKKGTAEVDDAFLKEIESWREMLARNLALRNPGLTQRQLNFAVQRTIDRIIFLRICEDRGIENYARLMALQNGPRVYQRLAEMFRDADDRYNSGLFHFRAERGRNEGPDEITLSLAIDDKPLKDIIKSLYYPDSPYEFSVLPADILGQVYEQFLGKVIQLTPGHHAKVVDKPEVKKAGGVYYTPTYIVDYIVQNTVGKLVEGKTPKQVEKLRILDPACGSGSFLIGAYQYLLDWHRDRYVEGDTQKWARRTQPPRLYQAQGGEWRLTTDERKRILLNNIHGVDIDTQAVEVTKLSLLLKILESHPQLAIAGHRMLPDLGGNIKCGNSLIGPDFYSGQQMTLLDDEERLRVNVFDWNAEFPQIMAAGGFDAVIGNPPYIRIQALADLIGDQTHYLKRRYGAAQGGSYDIYVLFVERGLSLLAPSGRLGFILPTKFMTTDYGAPLRHMLSSAGVLDRVVDFGHEQVFANATTYTCLLFLDRRASAQPVYLQTAPKLLASSPPAPRPVDPATLGRGLWLFGDAATLGLLAKLDRVGVPLLSLPASISRGSSTGADAVFCLVSDGETLHTRDGQPVDVEPEALRQPLYATDFTRFWFRPRNSERIVFPYRVSPEGYALVDESQLHREWPKAYQYLRDRRRLLEQRKQYQAWYGYSAPRNLSMHDHADIMVPLLANRGLFAPAPPEPSRFCVMASAGFSVRIVPPASPLSPFYVLGLVNSRLLFWKLQNISNRFRGGWITCTKQYFGVLPIRPIDFSDPEDKARHDRMVTLVEQMLSLHKQLAEAKLDHDKTAIQRQIDATDRRIDLLVYELYGLTEDEIALVEGTARREGAGAEDE